MDILSYLLELLQSRKEVGIANLGTFYKKKSPGRYDKEKQAFLPPSYSIAFNAEVKDENALANFIASKRNISAESATYYIEQFTDDIKRKLEVDHEAELDQLGRLFFTEHEGLSFEAHKNIHYGSEFYGLPTLPENFTEEPEVQKQDDKVNEETIEPQVTATPEPKPQAHPEIETIELDEVKDDLKNTLSNTEPESEEISPAPGFIRQQHEEHPDRFGHTPESETHTDKINQETAASEVPEFIKSQHEEHPERFGHTPEAEVLSNEINKHAAESDKQKTYLHLESIQESEAFIEAPDFIKGQHAEHPNRFGHDPLLDEPTESAKSIWPKIITAFFALLIIGAIIYYVKPQWFNHEVIKETKPVIILDTPKTTIDTAKARQDSIAKTDSILKANQVQPKPVDTVKKKVAAIKTEAPAAQKEIPAVINEHTTFDVIAASFKTEEKATEFIAQMKKLGVPAKMVKLPGRLKKVSIASFSTEAEARKQRPELAKKVKIKALDIIQINNTQP